MFLLIDKPKGITSHDVIDVVRRVTGERRVGHAGTLDPNATGLLVVGVGRDETKNLGSLTKDTKKTYEAEIYLGEERDTDDIEGKIIKSNNITQPSLNTLKRVIKGFIGKQEQIPPVYSAIKLGGRKAYELARRGDKLNLKTRETTVYSIKLVNYQYPILEITCRVSSGTYIRSLARDIGRRLGTYGYLKNLRRTGIGKFSVEKALPLPQLQQMHS